MKQIALGSQGLKVSKLALAWVLTRGEDITAIPGTRHIRYLEANAGALAITFSDEELAGIDDLFPVSVAAGARY